MTISTYLAIGAFALILLVAGAAALQEPDYGGSSHASAASSLAGGPPLIPHPISLNTVAYAERVVHSNISLPDAAPLGPGFRIVGVEIDRPPMDQSIGNGITVRFWSVNLYITNRPFVNGSTLSTDLFPQAVIANETPAGPNSSSYKLAQDFATPGQACVVSLGAHASSSCTQGQGPASQVIQIRNTFLAVKSSVPNAVFQIDDKGLVIAIYPATPDAIAIETSEVMSYQQLLALAGSIIP